MTTLSFGTAQCVIREILSSFFIVGKLRSQGGDLAKKICVVHSAQERGGIDCILENLRG